MMIVSYLSDDTHSHERAGYADIQGVQKIC